MCSSDLPQSGPSDGGTPVLITGSNFTDGRFLSCVFGNSSVSARIISIKEIECISPPSLAVATVDLRVTSNDIHDHERTLIFRYYKNPRVVFASPLYGPTTGGTVVVAVMDSSMESAESMMCMFGNMAVTGSWINHTAVSCVSPPLTTDRKSTRLNSSHSSVSRMPSSA